MDKFYFPARADKVAALLRDGIRLPQGDDPVIYVLGSRAAAVHFGKGLFGADVEVLEINASLATYETGETAPVGFIALSERVPASAISRLTRLKNISEGGRQYFGGRYGGDGDRSTAERTFKDYFGRTFHLRRDLDSEDKSYQLVGPIVADISGDPGTIEVDGASKFGSGLSWEAAEILADAAIGADIDLLRHLPRVKLFSGADHMPEYIQEGLDGVVVEIWEVSDDDIAQGRWGSWIGEPGWYWQRMDIAEVHGPFSGSDMAFRDTAENYDEPGVRTPASRPAVKAGR